MDSIASYLAARSKDMSDRMALISSRGCLTYLELQQHSHWCAAGLRDLGITRLSKVAVMVTPGPELFVIVFALIKLGAVLVLIDPGIGVRNLAKCLEKARPGAFIGVSRASWAQRTFRWARNSVSQVINVGRWGPPGAIRYRDVLETGRGASFEEARPSPTDDAALVFTSGSTGPPKGVVYTHRMFMAQAELLQTSYDIEPGEVDLACFPLFALYDPFMKVTTVLPSMDFSRPGQADPSVIIRTIKESGVTHMFGSPALLDRVGRYGVDHNVLLPSIKRVLSAGAPVSARILERFARLLPEGAEIHTPYGATEALPICSIRHSERQLLGSSSEGKGVCVGRPLSGVSLGIIGISEEPIQQWSDDLILPRGEIGELVVWGDNVSSHYFDEPEADRMAKIGGQPGPVRHRTGDLGYCDEAGRIWFCGRKSQRVVTRSGDLYTVPCESVFNSHPKVFRSALVGLGQAPTQKPVLCVELERGRRNTDRRRVLRELQKLSSSLPMTSQIRTVLFHPAFPVDIRHNSKISREKLAVWAARKLG